MAALGGSKKFGGLDIKVRTNGELRETGSSRCANCNLLAGLLWKLVRGTSLAMKKKILLTDPLIGSGTTLRPSTRPVSRSYLCKRSSTSSWFSVSSLTDTPPPSGFDCFTCRQPFGHKLIRSLPRRLSDSKSPKNDSVSISPRSISITPKTMLTMRMRESTILVSEDLLIPGSFRWTLALE